MSIPLVWIELATVTVTLSVGAKLMLLSGGGVQGWPLVDLAGLPVDEVVGGVVVLVAVVGVDRGVGVVLLSATPPPLWSPLPERVETLDDVD